MLEKLHVNGFRTLVDTEIQFDNLTIMIGKNGVGKTSILDVLQLLGNFARGGVERAFGPPPWSLGWQRTRGIGTVPNVRFTADVRTLNDQCYRYLLVLTERSGQPRIEEERLTKTSDQTTIASYSRHQPPSSGTILYPDEGSANADEITEVAKVFRSVVSYELNPALIEQGTDAEHNYISREGFGVAGFLGNLKDEQPNVFAKLEGRLKQLRPGTESIDVWASGKIYWGLRDRGQDRAFPACHLSWGDRQLLGLLCVLYGTKSGGTVAIEEIDRGFHHSRYEAVIEVLSEAVYDGLDGLAPIQIIVTTHSPSFINKLGDRSSEIRLVTRVPGGGTAVRPLEQVLHEKLGSDEPSASLGEVWEMGLLEEVVEEAMG